MSAQSEAASAPPVVILVEPQLGENIGAAARAMLNCGLEALRLVRPRDGWPSDKARSMAAGADRVIDGVRLFDSTADAVADLTRVYATTARPRDMVKPVLTPRAAAAEIRALEPGERAGILFGKESKGLTNDDVALADCILSVPLNPEHTSLNLGQAVLLAAYEWYIAGDDTTSRAVPYGRTRPAERQELLHFFAHLEGALDRSGFLHPPEKRAGMVRNLRTLFLRAELTEQEVRTLFGVVSSLAGPPPRGELGRTEGLIPVAGTVTELPAELPLGLQLELPWS